MSTPLRLGVVGTGYWADVTHAASAVAAPSWQLSAVWGRDAAKAEALAAHHGAPHAGTDFDAFLAQVDAVTFAVPPHLQAELALRAIEAGKHVALEKPIAVSASDAERLVEASTAHGVASVVLFTMLYDPRVRAVIAQARVPVLPADTPDTLAARVREQEHPLLLEVVRLLASGALRLTGGHVYLNGETLAAPLQLRANQRLA